MTNSPGQSPQGTAADAAPALTIWYDGGCPICTAEIGLMRRLDRGGAIDFVDLGPADVAPDVRVARLARLHAQAPGGQMVSGAAAFVAMWRVLPVLRPLAAVAAFPPILWLLERAYRLFLKVRPALQALARRRLARRAKAPR